MDGHGKLEMIKKAKPAVTIAVIGALVSLLMCTFLLCGSLFETLTPLWLIVLFGMLSFLIEQIPLTRSHKRLKISIQAICVVLAGVLLSLFF